MRMTVREWLMRWLVAVREEISPKSYERYAEIVGNFLVPELGALPITKLASAYSGGLHEMGERRATGREPGGLSPRTRRHVHRILKAALARAVEQQVLAHNPADAFRKRLPKVEPREMVTLTAEQSARLLKAIKHTRASIARFFSRSPPECGGVRS
jgi:integrase